MIEPPLLFAKFASQNAEIDLIAIELFDPVKLLNHAEQMVDNRLIEVSPPAELGPIQPETNKMDLSDL